MTIQPRRFLPTGVLCLAAFVAACGSDSGSPVAPSATGGATVQGVVAGSRQASSFGALRVSDDDGMHVEVEGTDLSTRVDDDGEFRLTGVPARREVRLRFVSVEVDDIVSLFDLDDGDVVMLRVSVQGNGIVVDQEERMDDNGDDIDDGPGDGDDSDDADDDDGDGPGDGDDSDDADDDDGDGPGDGDDSDDADDDDGDGPGDGDDSDDGDGPDRPEDSDDDGDDD